MAEHFAVADIGSNAMRFQVAAVMDRGRHYRIIHQDRKPVRLGHRVFQTGKLDPKVTESALKALKDFKSIADRHGVAAMHSVATAACGATDARSFCALQENRHALKSYPRKRRLGSLAWESSAVFGFTSPWVSSWTSAAAAWKWLSPI
jgi:exopolyphosphatase/pppGpp-phosphohydrolase